MTAAKRQTFEVVSYAMAEEDPSHGGVACSTAFWRGRHDVALALCTAVPASNGDL